MAKVTLTSDDSEIVITKKHDNKIDRYCLAEAIAKSIKAYDAAFKNNYNTELEVLVIEYLNKKEQNVTR